MKNEEDENDEEGNLQIKDENEIFVNESVVDKERKEIDVVFEYTVKNIPETLTIATLLRQFLKPKIHGCLISINEIDMEQMTPFIEKEISNLILYMRAPLPDKERYYFYRKSLMFLRLLKKWNKSAFFEALLSLNLLRFFSINNRIFLN